MVAGKFIRSSSLDLPGALAPQGKKTENQGLSTSVPQLQVKESASRSHSQRFLPSFRRNSSDESSRSSSGEDQNQSSDSGSSVISFPAISSSSTFQKLFSRRNSDKQVPSDPVSLRSMVRRTSSVKKSSQKLNQISAPLISSNNNEEDGSVASQQDVLAPLPSDVHPGASISKSMAVLVKEAFARGSTTKLRLSVRKSRSPATQAKDLKSWKKREHRSLSSENASINCKALEDSSETRRPRGDTFPPVPTPLSLSSFSLSNKIPQSRSGFTIRSSATFHVQSLYGRFWSSRRSSISTGMRRESKDDCNSEGENQSDCLEDIVSRAVSPVNPQGEATKSEGSSPTPQRIRRRQSSTFLGGLSAASTSGSVPVFTEDLSCGSNISISSGDLLLTTRPRVYSTGSVESSTKGSGTAASFASSPSPSTCGLSDSSSHFPVDENVRGYLCTPDRSMDSPWYATLEEELQEFVRMDFASTIEYPVYLSLDERKAIANIATSLGLCVEDRGLAAPICAYKRVSELEETHKGKGDLDPSANESISDSTSVPLDREEHTGLAIGRHNNDMYINIPDLAQKKKECGENAHMLLLSLPKTQSRTQRLNSISGRRRDLLLDIIDTENQRCIYGVEEGEGGVYQLQAGSGETVAIFKPIAEEGFVREGLTKGEGAARELAAFHLDSCYGGFASVPATALAVLDIHASAGSVHQDKDYRHNGRNTMSSKRRNRGGTACSTSPQRGSVQRFVKSTKGSMADFGMPRALADAAKILPVDEVHKIAVFDIRVFNTDRHLGNLLLVGDKAPFSVVPIDHGCILPSWFNLAEARFDWVEWPQSAEPFSERSKEHIRALNVDNDAKELRGLGIREECIATMRICTIFLKCAALGLPKLREGCENNSLSHPSHLLNTPRRIASVMMRKGCLEEPSELELMVEKAAKAVGIAFSFRPNDYGEQTSIVAQDASTRRPLNRFFRVLEDIFEKFIYSYVPDNNELSIYND